MKGTSGFRGTQVEKHCTNIMSHFRREKILIILILRRITFLRFLILILIFLSEKMSSIFKASTAYVKLVAEISSDE